LSQRETETEREREREIVLREMERIREIEERMIKEPSSHGGREAER
jgi:hypothetical protein